MYLKEVFFFCIIPFVKAIKRSNIEMFLSLDDLGRKYAALSAKIRKKTAKQQQKSTGTKIPYHRLNDTAFQCIYSCNTSWRGRHVQIFVFYFLKRPRKCLRFTPGLINVAINKSGLCQEERGPTAAGLLKPYSNKKHVLVFRTRHQ